MKLRRALACIVSAGSLAACGVGTFTFDGRPGNEAGSNDAVADGSVPMDAPRDIVVGDASDIVPATDGADAADAPMMVDSPVNTDAGADVDCISNCVGGTCAGATCMCPALQAHCGSACVDTQTDFQNCGTCGITCSPPVCSAGHCGCPTGSTYCSGACVDLSTAVNHCGSCSNPCATGHVCQGGVCSCPTGMRACTDGTCMTCAATTGGTPTCAAAACGVACTSGYAPFNPTTCCPFAAQGFDKTGTGANTLTLTAGSYTIGGAFNDTGSVSIGPTGAGTLTDSSGCTFNVTFAFTGSSCIPGVTLRITVTSNPSLCSGTSYFAGMWVEQ